MSSPLTTPESSAPTGEVRPKTVLAIVFASILGSVLLGGAITGLILWLDADLREQTHLFLGHARARRDHEAYGLTTQAFQLRVPEVSFGAYLDQHAPGVRQSSGEWINGGSGGLSEVCMEAWLHDSARDSVYVLFLKEGDLWRVNDVTHVEVANCYSD